MAALAILAFIMTSLAYTASLAFRYSSVARQRETGSGYALQSYQQALALPFTKIKLGLNPANDTTYSTDTNIVTNSTTCSANGASAPCVKIPGLTNCGTGSSECWEPIVTTSGASGNCPAGATPPSTEATPPLCPHERVNSPPGSTTIYKTDTYITRPTTCVNCYRVVVVNAWSPEVAPGASGSVTYQSLMTDSAGGCLGTGTHPFSGPCNAYLGGQALVPLGTITITPNSGTGVNGIALSKAMVYLPEVATTSQTSQVSVVQGVTNTSGVSLQLTSQSTADLKGSKYLASLADNDLALPDNPYQNTDLSSIPDTSGSLSAPAGLSATGCTSGTSNAICLSKSANDTTGRTTVTTAASVSQNPSCNGETSALPCSYSISRATNNAACPGTMGSCVVIHLWNGATDLGTCTLVSVGAPASDSSAFTYHRTGTPNNVTARAVLNLGQITVGCLPNKVAPPSAWNSTSNLTGFTPVNQAGTYDNKGFLAGIKTGYTQTLQTQAGLSTPSNSATVGGTEWYYSPNNVQSAGGTLNAKVGALTSSWPSGGTLNAAVGPTAAGAGTLAAAMGSDTDTFSALGTLYTAITSAATTFNVVETATPPATPFVIKVDSELMNVTLRKTTGGGCNTAGRPCYTVTRGYGGTTAAAHLINAPVTYRSATGCPSPCVFNVNETVAPSTSPPFNILIGSEQLTVNSRTLVSGSTYTYSATRAAAGTTAAPHASGAGFTEVVTTCPSPCVFTVNETATPPATPFVIQIDSEQMNVTSRTGTGPYTYTATRAYNSTTAAPHSSGAAVNHQVPGCPTTCSFNVTETAAPPSAAPFTILVDSEQMTVTTRTLVSGSTYTYATTRAVNSTTAAIHNSGTTFYYIYQAGYATQTDSTPSGTSLPVTSLNYTTGGCTYNESVTGLTSPTGSVSTTGGPVPGTDQSSTGTLTAPLKGDFMFNVTCGGTTVADLKISVDIGTMLSTSSYSPAAT